MSRRWTMVLMAVVMIAVAPAFVGAQDFTRGITAKPHQLGSGQHWSRLDFGAPVFVPQPKPGPGVWRSRFDPPLNESPWRHAPRVIRSGRSAEAVEIEGLVDDVTPIDCAMAKHGSVALDPKIIQPPPANVRHSGVIMMVAPCRVVK